MGSQRWLGVALLLCTLASACSQYNTNLSVQTSSSTLTFVSPTTWPVGGQGFTITANGTGFVSGAFILWNGAGLTTTFVSSTQLTAPVPVSDLTNAGPVQIAIDIPGSAVSPTSNPNNGNVTTTTEVSNIVIFTVTPKPGTPPAITSLSASTTSQASAPYCSPNGFTLTVTGTNFTSDSVVNWNGSPRATTLVSATQLTASISATDAAFPGTAKVTATNSAGVSNSLPFTLSSPTSALPAPTISSLSQTSAAAASPAFTVTVQGTVLPCTIVRWTDSSNVTSTLATTYVAGTGGGAATLNAVVPAADLVGAGTVQTANVSAFNLGPGGGASPTSLPFMIVPPAITSLSASTTPSCSASALTLTVNGTNFVNGSIVEWIVSPQAPASVLATQFVGSTQLIATVPATYIASTGTLNIQVSNSGALSNMTPFTISASSPPKPTITSISPTMATAGAAGATLIVNGTNLLPCSGVQWTSGTGTTQLATTYVAATQSSSAQLIATVPTADIAAVGTVQVAVANPVLSTNLSTAVSFQIVLATITSLSASTTGMNNTPYCSPTAITLTVNGTGFADGLVVNWNGSPRPTTFMSTTQLTAAITAADTAFLGTGAAAVAVTVSGGPRTNSNSLKFSLIQLSNTTPLPLPVLNLISPNNAAVETPTGPPVAMTANGSALSSCSVVQWNGSALPTTIFIGPSGIASVIPAANITAAGTDQVTVFTPSLPSSECTPGPGVNCGGGTSGGVPFTVFTGGSPSATNLAGGSLSLPLMSADQRYQVFVLASTDGSSETPGATQNVFVTDTCQGVPSGCTPSTALVSAGVNGNPANGDSIAPSISGDISADGRYVSFLSSATNLVTGGTSSVINAFVRDTCAGVSSGCTPSTQLVSVSTGGTQANGATISATISPTGRYVTFESTATNLGVTSTSGGVFLRDTCAGAPSGCTPSTQELSSH